MQVVLARLKVGHRFWLNVGVSVAAIIVLLFIVLNQFHDNQIAERKLAMRTLVETTYGVIERYGKLAQKGELAEAEAQARAMASVQSLRYENAGYFWINDTVPTMVMHPHKPELIGKNLADAKDADGQRLFIKFVETAKSNPDGGVVEYSW
ncbi:MAG: cache domain-containing protein, partial [Chromatiales bacterium]|nr:cache domain-containing protein [Chromatiales bacterium]